MLEENMGGEECDEGGLPSFLLNTTQEREKYRRYFYRVYPEKGGKILQCALLIEGLQNISTGFCVTTVVARYSPCS